MSSEEKEAYFDGPLVTTPTAQGLFYPGGNPQPFVPMAAMGQPAALAPQPPMFFNPGNVVNANSWEAPAQQPFQPQFNAGPQSNPVLPGAQAYFGGVHSGESASSSEQTSPERRPFQKLTDVRLFNPTNFEHHVNPSGASALFTPQTEDAANTSNLQPVSYTNQFVEQAEMQSVMPPSGGASGQQSFVPPPASTAFAPSLDVGGAGVQTYMNPVLHNNAQQQQNPFFIPCPNPDLTQAAPIMDKDTSEDHHIIRDHSFDLHNGATNAGVSGSDQRYLNMAYNHNSSGNAQAQDTEMNAYVSREFQPEAGLPMMIPVTSSGQDYDILHSQGTWKNHHPAIQDDSENQVRDPVDIGAELESNSLQENVAPPLISNDTNLVNHDLGASFQVQEVSDQVPQLEASIQLTLNHSQTNNVMSVSGSSDLNQPHIPKGDSSSNPCHDYLKHDEFNHGQRNDSGMLTLDYAGSYGSSQPLDMPQADLDADIDKRHQDRQQSYEDVELADNVAASNIGPVTTQELSSNQLQDEGYAVGGSVIAPEQPNESPIPSDGLHHKQPVIDVLVSSPSHQFASPNSAFESRIRSQSIGSNNSNSSSQKSASGLSGRSAQNRSFSQLGSTGELNNTAKTESVPASGPFNTNTMHSSFNPDFVASTPPAPPARATIPDIVRPLPPNSSDENLRTGATMVPYSSSQSLHSQVLRNITAYPPEPEIPVSSSSFTVSSSGISQLDLVQSPSEGPGAILKTSAVTDVVNTVAGLKISDERSAPPSAAQASSDSHNPYLAQLKHNPSSNPQPSNVESRDVPKLQDSEVSMASTPNHSTAKTDDLREQSVKDEPSHGSSHNEDRGRRDSFDKERRYDDDNVKKDFRDSKWSDDRYRKEEQRSRDGDRYRRDDDYMRDGDRRERDDEYRRRDDDYRSRDDDRHRWHYDHPDDSYRDRDDRYSARSRHDQHSRPSSRQSGYAHEDSFHSRRYDDPYYNRSYRDPYYTDSYWNDRYRGYGRRDYYEYDPRSGAYYNYERYPDYYRDYYDYGREAHEYRYREERHPDVEDSKSIYSEKSHTAEHNMTDRDWSGRQDYPHYEDSRYEYPPSRGYYGESTIDGSTMSHTLDESWHQLPPAPARQTPVKFGSVHTIVRFGAGGQLIKVRPNRPTDNQPTTVEIHSVEVLLQNTEEAEDLRSYPGPLSKEETHKNDVLQFTSNQAMISMKDSSLMDRQSTALIWDFLSILVRQNGSVLGTDIAELLTKDHSGDFGLLQSPLEAIRQKQSHHERATPISVSDEPVASPSPAIEQTETKSIVSNASVDVSTVSEKNCFRFRDLLLHGRKKDALEWAMKSGLWGHALLLASKTDSRTHAQVMLRFANSLPINDPLQTVYQLMSGRQPASATCVSEEGWGDWRPHLAMILSNPTQNPSLDMRAVLTMGDTLSARGLLHAAHFCYLMSSTPLGYYGRTSSKMVLLGGNHMLVFDEFAKWESIRRTEIYEYAISLGKQQKSSSASMSLPSFQLYKFLYACKLAEYGLIAQAFHYCERIAKSVCKNPAHYSPTLVNQLVNLSDQLRNHDPQMQAGVTQAENLRWLETLRNIVMRMQAGSIVPRANAASSLMTTSNTPSVVSSSPSSEQIEFKPHTSDLDDDEAEGNVAYRSHKTSVSQYGRDDEYHRESRANTHVENTTTPAMYDPTQAMHQAPTQGQNYLRDISGLTVYGTSNMLNYGNPPVQNYENRPVQNYANADVPFSQQATTADKFGHLADRANPLSAAYPSAGAPGTAHVPYQTQNSYGFQPQPVAAEGAEQHDQVDYYNHIENTRAPHQPDPARNRTVSQSSQRSRGSTVRGVERTTPTATIPYGNSMQGRRSRTTSEHSAGKRSRKTSGDHRPTQEEKGKENKGIKKSGSWLPDWFSFPRRKSKQVHLPDDNEKEIVWDNDKQRWVNKNATEEENAPPPPPPTDRSMATAAPAPSAPSSIPGENSGPGAGAPQLTANRFSRGSLGGKQPRYKNPFDTSSKPAAAPAPVDLPGLFIPNAPAISGFMVPNPVPTSQPLQSTDNEAIPQRSHVNPPYAAQSIAMFTPGNTPHGSANDFTQPFNHEYLARNSSSSSISSSAREVQNLTNVADGEPSHAPNMAPSGPMNAAAQDTSSSAGPTMFFNPSQLAAQPDLLAQPSLPPAAGRGNPMRRRGGGRPMYPGRT